jgi:hypothetical protein
VWRGVVCVGEGLHGGCIREWVLGSGGGEGFSHQHEERPEFGLEVLLRGKAWQLHEGGAGGWLEG